MRVVDLPCGGACGEMARQDVRDGLSLRPGVRPDEESGAAAVTVKKGVMPNLNNKKVVFQRLFLLVMVAILAPYNRAGTIPARWLDAQTIVTFDPRPGVARLAGEEVHAVVLF